MEQRLVRPVIVPGPLPPEKGKDVILSEIMNPVVQNYLSRTAAEKKRFPPIQLKMPDGKILPKRKNLAVCGLATTTRHQAPFKDPDWDIWTMHMGVKLLERVDLLFEPHDPEVFGDYEKDYCEVLQTLNIPVMMMKKYDRFPTSLKLPWEELVEQFGRFFSTSVAWMMALGIRQGYERIDLYGVEMEHNTEYITQAKSVVYFIGVAEGRGIEVGMPRACQLMKNRYLYGLETAQQDEVIQRIDKHEAELGVIRSQMETQLAHLQQEHMKTVGSMEECGQIKRRILLAD